MHGVERVHSCDIMIPQLDEGNGIFTIDLMVDSRVSLDDVSVLALRWTWARMAEV